MRNVVRRRKADERGVTLVLISLMMVSLLLMVAIVIDLGVLRQDRQGDRSAVDAAVTTAAIKLGSSGSRSTACSAAWASVARSLNVAPPTDPCSTAFASACDPNVAQTVNGSMGDAIVYVTNPVPAGDPLMRAETPGGDQSQAIDVVHDGSDACARIGVRIVYNRRPFFAQVAGINSFTTDIHAVARFSTVPRPGGDVPALVALDQTGCGVVDAKSGSIVVYPPLGSAGPGIIRTDTNNNGCTTDFVMRVQNGSAGLIRVDGPGGPGTGQLVNLATSNVFRPEASKAPPGITTSGYFGIPTTATARVTRNPFDLIYRCSISIPASGSACPNGQPDIYNSTIAPLLTGVPAGFKVLNATSANGLPANNCNNPPAVMTGDWYVDCSPFSKPAAFSGSGTVVFVGGVDVSQLVLNCAFGAVCTTDKLVIIRGTGGGSAANLKLQSSGAVLDAPRTTIYQQSGNIDMGGGPTVRWTAPTSSTTPTRNLMYWNESTSGLSLSGNPSIESAGVAFVPNSTVLISGNGLIDARLVQFWAKRVEITSGSAELRLQPDPSHHIPTSGAVSFLIR